MCGIIGTYVNDPEYIKSEIMLIYEAQKTRGTDGFGILVRKEDGSFVRDRTTTYSEIKKSHVWNEISENNVVIFHHRQPTSTPNVPKCNHPFVNEDSTIALAHNGIVPIHIQQKLLKHLKNHQFESTYVEKVLVEDCPAKTQKKTKRTARIKRRTIKKRIYTDSEIVLHYFEELVKYGKHDALEKIQTEISGTFLITMRNSDSLYFLSNSSDIAIYESETGNTYVTSEIGKAIGDCIGSLNRNGITFLKREEPLYFHYKRHARSIAYLSPYDDFDYYNDENDEIIETWEELKYYRGCPSCYDCPELPVCISTLFELPEEEEEEEEKKKVIARWKEEIELN